MTYDANPSYPVVGGDVETGYEPLAAELVRKRPTVLAVDGPAAIRWERFIDAIVEELSAAGPTCETLDVRGSFAPWAEIERRTASATLPGDPVFGRVFEGSLASLFDGLPYPGASSSDIVLVYGPGSSLVPHRLLWYADLPKRLALAAVKDGTAGNVGGRAGSRGSEQRLMFVDWPLIDRHKQALSASLDRYVDLTDPGVPRSLEGEALRHSLRALAAGPFRTRPTFLAGAWGGRWLQRTLGAGPDAPNLGWSYELITLEGGLLLGAADRQLEVGFELLMAQEGEAVLGEDVAERFGLSFPIRFDYLDTVDGGHLSIQCHPSEEYMRDTFGLPYTQHESYYVMETTPGAEIFLGLRDSVDLDAFRVEVDRAEQSGRAFDPRRYLQARPAEQHRLYLIPAGTPHASGAGNLVLEISATPYLYTLRFYDWLRRDLDGNMRPVHVEHAFANLDPRRAGEAVRRELIQIPTTRRRGPGAAEFVLGRLPELFFAVHRLDFEDEIGDDTRGRFLVLNLVAGDQVEIETSGGRSHCLSYAETIVIPASVGPYRLRRIRGGACKVVKAFVV